MKRTMMALALVIALIGSATVTAQTQQFTGLTARLHGTHTIARWTQDHASYICIYHAALLITCGDFGAGAQRIELGAVQPVALAYLFHRGDQLRIIDGHSHEVASAVVSQPIMYFPIARH